MKYTDTLPIPQQTEAQPPAKEVKGNAPIEQLHCCVVHVDVRVPRLEGQGDHGWQWTALLPAVVAALIVMIGWGVSESFARRREMRSDLRELCRSFEGFVQGIVSSSVDYYALPGAVPQARSLAITLKAKIGDLSRMISAMNNAGMPINANEQIKNFRMAITGDDFESLAREAIVPDHAKLSVIKGRAEELKSAVRIAFYDHFVPGEGWWRRHLNAFALDRMLRKRS